MVRASFKRVAGIAAAAVVAVCVGAVAQNAVTLSPQAQAIWDAYAKGSPPNGESLYNYALYYSYYAIDQGDDDSKITATVNGARDWLFTLSESQLTALAQTFKDRVRQRFGKLYQSAAVQSVMSKSFGAGTLSLYRAWYDCFAKTKIDAGDDVGPDE